MKNFALLMIVSLLAGTSANTLNFNDLLGGGYLPPVPSSQNEQCAPLTQTSYATEIITQSVNQPINIETTRTAFAQALATATMAQTTYMLQTEIRQVQIPVTRSYQMTSINYQTALSSIVVPAQDIINTATETRVVASTQANQITRTQTQNAFNTIRLTNTILSTAFNLRTSIQTIQTTQTYTPPVIFRTQTSFREIIQTQTRRLPDFSSIATSIAVKSSQLINYFTPRPFVQTSIQQSTAIQTSVQQVVQTQQAFASVEVTLTSAIQRFTTLFQTQTSEIFSQRLREVTSTIDRIITNTQVIPQYITSTSIIDNVNQQFRTQTQTQYITDTQTVQGPNQQITQIVTMRQNQVQVITSTINNIQQSTTEVIITQPCARPSQTGYNYNAPNNPINFF